MDMDSEVFRGKSKASAQRWRDVVEIILTDMGAHDSTMDEKGCSLYFYVSTKLHQVLGMIISEMVLCLMYMNFTFSLSCYNSSYRVS
jgi:hypothetical protein